MKVFEKINEEKCKYLLSLKKYEFDQLFPKTDEDHQNEKDFTFKNTIFYCKRSLKSNCNLEIEYAHSNLNPTSGRLFAKGGLQNMRKSARKFLTEGIYRDWDMCNAHPSIMLLACQKRGFQCSELKKYCANREAFLLKEGVGKKWMLALFNTDRFDYKTKHKSDAVKKLAAEMTRNKQCLFEEFKLTYKYKDGYNPVSSCVNAFWCDRENLYLQDVIKGLDRTKLGPLCFDGFMFDHSVDLTNTFVDSSMDWDEKENKSDVQIPPSFKPEDLTEVKVTYEDKKREFEEDYNATKIISPPCFVITLRDTQEIFKKDGLFIAFENMTYEVLDKNGQICKKQFIKEWFKDENMQYKEVFGVFTENEVCPDHVYNMWVPFECTQWELENYKYDESKVNIYLNLIHTLCNNEENVFRFVEKWIAQIFQFPHIKPEVALTLIGECGIGKDKFLDVLVALMGERKRFESISPERDIWGDFNGQLLECMLVHLSEIGKMNTTGASGKVRSMITAPTIFTNSKFKPPVSLKSIHRFVTLTNSLEPKTCEGKDQRRDVVMFGKSTYKNNGQFWDAYVNDILKNKHALYSIYEHFMNVKDVPEGPFKKIDRFFSRFQVEMTEQNQPFNEAFMQYLLEGYVKVKKLMDPLFKLIDDASLEAIHNIGDDQSMFNDDKEKAKALEIEQTEERKLNTFGYWFYKVNEDPSISSIGLDLVIHPEEPPWNMRLRESIRITRSQERGYELLIPGSGIYSLFQNFLRNVKKLSPSHAQEYSCKSFCSKLTAMRSNYSINKKRVPQGTKYVLCLDLLVDELSIDQNLEDENFKRPREEDRVDQMQESMKRRKEEEDRIQP